MRHSADDHVDTGFKILGVIFALILIPFWLPILILVGVLYGLTFSLGWIWHKVFK